MKKAPFLPVEKMTYEQALGELEKVVETLENSQPDLEDSLAMYERGQALAQHCAALLDQAELRVQKLSELEPDLPETDEED